jgi:hypothetical protein
VKESPTPLVPAKAWTQFSSQDALIFANANILRRDWIPAFAGMSGESISSYAMRSIAQRCVSKDAVQGCRALSAALDAIAQIRLFVKLKLTNCAPILGLPEIGFFMGAQVG